MNWTTQILSFLPDAVWTPGSWLTGNKKRIGWVIIMIANTLWMVFAVYVKAWPMLFWASVTFCIAGRNWWKWGKRAS